MCGITGILSLSNKPIDPYSIKKMCDVVSYRGPDDAGYTLFSQAGGRSESKSIWLELTDNTFKHINVNLAPIESDYARNEIASNNWHLALGHRRLSIIDLSARAHQPMSDRAKTVWLSYNGEIYNFKDLRAELEKEGYVFYSNSDTEVIIYSYLQWGIECLEKLNGMFAFALWDNTKNKLFLARDRYGVKPLYYYHGPDSLIFGSEIKSLLQSGDIKKGIDTQALNEYFTFQNIFSDHTLFKEVKLLPAGSYIEVSVGEKPDIRFQKYWDFCFSPGDFSLSASDAVDELRRLFNKAVSRQLVSDVPLGCYLSGGMDSGSMASIMRHTLGRISTFTCGFDLSSASGLELAYDERQQAEVLANLLKTEHYEVVLHAGDMEAIMPELIWHLEDLRIGQCYPNYYAARLAGKFVKVVLSGAGGDELFGGYPWRYYLGIGSKDRADYLRRYYEYWQRLVPDNEKEDLFRPEVYRAGKGISSFDVFCSVFDQGNIDPGNNEEYVNASLYFEAKTFLHGIFLIEDKISMAHSLETRVPFLDNDLVNFAIKVPPRLKLSNMDKKTRINEDDLHKKEKYYLATKDGKNILRQSMEGLLPRETLEREKQGFSAPDASWFRGESIDYIKQLMSGQNTRIYEYLNHAYVQKRLEEHMSGKYNHRLFIWSLLSIEWWLRKFM